MENKEKIAAQWVEQVKSADSQLQADDRVHGSVGGRRLTSAEASRAAVNEKMMSIRESIWAYRKGLLWCLAVSTCVIMEGYDTILIGNFYALQTFASKYGQYYPDIGEYQLTPAWQAALSNASGIGAFFGVLINGILVNKFGVRRTLFWSLIILTGFLFIVFFAVNIEMLLIGEILCGLPWGVFASTAPAFASECLPVNLRVYLTSWTNMCFVIGQLIAAGVLAGVSGLESHWAYRIPFAIQWIWPAFLIPVIFFAPESPWHLVRSNRLDEAEINVKRIISADSGLDSQAIVANIVHTDQLEREMEVGTSYLDCFKGTEARRTEIACVAFAGQVLSGSSFAYNASYFFVQVGIDIKTTYHLAVGGTALALFGCFVSWILVMPYFGRRTIYIAGMAAETVVLAVIGILNTRTSMKSVGLAQASLTLLWTFFFQLSIGQLGWAIPAEAGSTRLRQKTVCLARNSYYIVSVISQVLEPYFINPTAWNLQGYTGFVWAGTAGVTLIWAILRLPEFKGRSYEELDVLFAKKVSARKFKRTKVDVFDNEEVAEVAERERASRRTSVISKIEEKV